MRQRDEGVGIDLGSAQGRFTKEEEEEEKISQMTGRDETRRRKEEVRWTGAPLLVS